MRRSNSGPYETDRYYRLDIRVTKEERNGLKKEAMDAGMNLGEYVRQLLGLPRSIKLRKGVVVVSDQGSKNVSNARLASG
jgi:hypothetical protein